MILYSSTYFPLTDNSFRGEKVFTFQIGPTKEEIQMHPSVVKAISQPLYALMTNGHLEESISRVAKLPEADPETFHLFTQWAYSRTYHSDLQIHDSNTPQEWHEGLEAEDPDSFKCRRCCKKYGDNSNHPFCSYGCKSGAISNGSFKEPFCTHCGCNFAPAKRFWTTDDQELCEDCIYKWDRWTGGTSCTIRFCKLTLGIPQDTSDRFLKLYDTLTPKSKPMLPLYHAKLHNFADMYLCDELKQFSLWRLHQDLATFVVSETTVKQIGELLLYVYQSTSDAMVAPGKVHQLKSLVCTYVLEQSKTLAMFKDIIAALSADQDLLQDVVLGLAAAKKD